MSLLHRDKYFVKLFIGFRSSVSRLYKLYYTWYEFFIIFLALMRGWNNNLIFFFSFNIKIMQVWVCQSDDI